MREKTPICSDYFTYAGLSTSYFPSISKKHYECNYECAISTTTFGTPLNEKKLVGPETTDKGMGCVAYSLSREVFAEVVPSGDFEIFKARFR